MPLPADVGCSRSGGSLVVMVMARACCLGYSFRGSHLWENETACGSWNDGRYVVLFTGSVAQWIPFSTAASAPVS